MKGTRGPVCFSEYGLKDGLRKWTMLNCIWQQNTEPHKQPRRQTTTSKVIGPEQDWSRLPTSIILPLLLTQDQLGKAKYAPQTNYRACPLDSSWSASASPGQHPPEYPWSLPFSHYATFQLSFLTFSLCQTQVLVVDSLAIATSA